MTFSDRIKALAILGLLLLFLDHGGASFAADAAICGLTSSTGERCAIAVDQIRPTQLTFGAIEVERRAVKLGAMSDEALQRYLERHLVPVVVAPDGGIYITDHHHLALALATAAGRSALISAVIVENWSSESPSQFWRKMQAANLVYLYDERGEGPRPLTSLPVSLFGLKDDPFRSLAWGVNNNGGYNDTDVPYADFKWANFFRTRLDRTEVQENFDAAVEAATKLAHSPDARDLPGYNGK